MLRVIVAGFVPGCAFFGVAAAQSADPDARARLMLERMTDEEKLTLLHGPMPAFLPRAARPAGVPLGAGVMFGVPRLDIPNLVETDASLGVANFNNVRRGDVATALPSSLSLAATWDTGVAQSGGAMIGSEARAKGFNVMLAGGVNLVRDPRAGRTFEYLGEDPLLAGRLVGAHISGVQSNGIIATIKHFAMNDLETGRSVHSVDMAETPMRESDLLAFQIGIETGNPGSVMCAYNRVNGIYACENPFLLTTVLRKDWGFKGYVMSDWGAVHSSEAILAGLDQQSGEQFDAKRWFSTVLKEDVAKGRIPAQAIDTAALRILRTMYASGIMDRTAEPQRAIDYAANANVAQSAAEQGIVLLRNEGGILPLASTARSIAVIGGHADLGVLSGGGSSQVRPVGGFTLEERVPNPDSPAANVAKRSYGGSSPVTALRKLRPDARITFHDGADVAAAAEAARSAEIAIVFGEKWATEAADVKDLSLDRDGDALVAAVAAANPRTVVVLQTGNPVAMPWRDAVGGILAAWYPGQRGGDAIARVLTGAVNPSGHLPVTFPANVEQLPSPTLPGGATSPASGGGAAIYGSSPGKQGFSVRFPEGADVGYRWFDKRRITPLYAFGHGLSYTSFRYGNLKVSGGRTLRVDFTVTNTGDRAGADVPQVYVTRHGRAKRLIGWSKPLLSPGETRRVSVTADPRIVGDYDAKGRRWVVPAGSYGIEVGISAVDPVLTAQARLSRGTFRP